ncbi:hypothetical protein DITRI_Ditri10aG0154300 [Diplodiscus trichospermus]
MDSMKKEGLPLVDPFKAERRLESAAASAMTKKGAYAALGYMLSAVLLVLFNKAALSSFSFPYVNVITLFQMLCSSVILYAMKSWKIISFTEGEAHSVTSNPVTLVPLKTLFRTLPLAVSYLLYMLITMESVRGINVPMYTTLRRTTVAFTMIVEYLLTGRKHSSYVVGSVGIIILGAFVAGARDLSFDAYSYSIVFVANICTAIYLASIARIGIFPFSSLPYLLWNFNFFLSIMIFFSIFSGKSSGLNSFGLMWCNGIICTPILLFWTSFKGDLEAMMSFPYLYSRGFQAVMLLSCIMAFMINYYVFLNTTLNSALTQTICGNLKDLFTIALGWLLFGGLPFDLMNVVGQSLGFLGSCLYAYFKLKGK